MTLRPLVAQAKVIAIVGAAAPLKLAQLLCAESMPDRGMRNLQCDLLHLLVNSVRFLRNLHVFRMQFSHYDQKA